VPSFLKKAQAKEVCMHVDLESTTSSGYCSVLILVLGGSATPNTVGHFFLMATSPLGCHDPVSGPIHSYAGQVVSNTMTLGQGSE
jgi:hypothetical protein